MHFIKNRFFQLLSLKYRPVTVLYSGRKTIGTLALVVTAFGIGAFGEPRPLADLSTNFRNGQLPAYSDDPAFCASLPFFLIRELGIPILLTLSKRSDQLAYLIVE